jgi:flavin reductase (DIM6/NTAB) family NADH-FMN oxidoreductase RutF
MRSMLTLRTNTFIKAANAKVCRHNEYLFHLTFCMTDTPSFSGTPEVPTQPSFSMGEFRSALGMFATGVTIITAKTAQGELVGLTANSFNSVSLSPPLVLWSLSRTATTLEAFSSGSHYAIHVLSASQHALAMQFASKSNERWKSVDYSLSANGVPLLSGCAARFECHNRSRYEEGDHIIFVGQVEQCHADPSATPLLYHGGKFYTELPL